MALGTATAAQAGGRSPSRPSTHDHLSFAGDDAYPSGGTLAFEAFVQAALGRTVELLSCAGYGYAAGGALTHMVRYDFAADSLLVYQLSDGAEVANTTDLSSTTFRIDCASQ